MALTVKKKHALRGIKYDMSDFLGSCVTVYCNLASGSPASLKPVSTPCLDQSMIPNYEWDNPGLLAKGTHVPAKIIMKLLYAARVARPALLQSTCHLARFITRWTLAHDRMLNRLMSYVNCTTAQALISIIGDEPQDCRLVAYVDADHASDKRDKKSTSGVVLFLVGPNTLAPITAFSKAQSCVSHSSTESELVALDQCIRSEAVPITWFWEQVMPILGCKYTLGVPIGSNINYLTSPLGFYLWGMNLKSLFLAMSR